jgi:hypothetical protein
VRAVTPLTLSEPSKQDRRAGTADMVGNQAGGMAAGRHAEPDDLGFSA